MKVFTDGGLPDAGSQSRSNWAPGFPDQLQLLDLLPGAVYTTDVDGKITFYNDAAAQLWGARPELGQDAFDGAWRFFWPDGTKLLYASSPMMLALKAAAPNRGLEFVVERPDGRRIPILPFPTPLFDQSGVLVGVLNLLVDLSERQQNDQSMQRLAAIVESSDDAILAKNLDGYIMSWNQAAERLFGYTAEEAVGKHVTLLIPEERHDEEPAILGRIRRGERIEHYDTVRRRKDGSYIDISLTVSPVRNAKGEIVGASKIARDITERRRAEEQQQLLLREMDHRVKNLFALASSVVTLSARSVNKTEDLVTAVRARLGALSRAHALTLTKISDAACFSEQPTTMHALIRTIVLPFDMPAEAEGSRVSITGPDVAIGGRSITSVAMLLHEFVTNAAKHGSLSSPSGFIDIECCEEGPRFVLLWTERGGPPVGESGPEGFGTMLGRLTVASQLEGEIERDWNPDGLRIRLAVTAARLNG
jgi:PAS domain S-box-containing protein